MPTNKHFSDRINKLNEYFRNTMRPLTLDEIIEKLEDDLRLESISKRTVQQDITHLQEQYPDEIKRIRQGSKVMWTYENANFSIHNVPVDQEELSSLQQAADIISAMKTFSVSKSLQEIVLKLKQAKKLDENVSNNFIQFETNENTKGYKNFDPIYEAIKEGTVLRITYQRFISEAKREFLIHPYLLKEYRNRWYVVCLIDSKNDITTFALDRIVEIQNSSKPFQPNRYFDPEKYFHHVIGIYRKKDDKPVKIKIKVAEKQAAYFNTQPLHHTQQLVKTYKDGSVLMEYNLIINLELKQLLLSYAGSIKVIEPVGLKEEIVEIIKGIL